MRAIAGLALLTAFGALGYRAIEGMAWFDALYLTIVTISTVGFGDITPQTLPGKLFAMLLIVMGVGAALYLLSVIAEGVLAGRLRSVLMRSAMMRKIQRLEGHVIVCGFGRFGRIVVDELLQAGRSLVVVESDLALGPDLERLGIDFVLGSATRDEILEQAAVVHAEALVVATSDEADNVFITLSARELNPGIRIHARAESESGIRRLRQAGADFVNSPYQMGGIRTAASLLRPSVVDFLELSAASHGHEIDLEEVRVGPGAAIAASAVREIEADNPRLRIVALKQPGQSIQLIPRPDERIQAGDHLVVIGEREQLAALAQKAISNEGQ